MNMEKFNYYLKMIKLFFFFDYFIVSKINDIFLFNLCFVVVYILYKEFIYF